MGQDNMNNDTFPKLLRRNAAERGKLPALREKRRGIWHTQTWASLADEVAALAAALQARGLVRGAHVGFLGDNRPRLFAGMAAAQWLGGVVVPLFQDATADELADPLQAAAVTHVFAENQEQVDKLLQILPRCPSIACIIFDQDRGMRHYDQPQLTSYEALLAQGRSLPLGGVEAELARGRGADAACLIFTTGTAGAAKGVLLSHAGLIDRAQVAATHDRLTDADVTLAYLPPAWIGQHMVGYAQSLVVGYCTCCPESSDTMLADLREISPTYLLAPARVLKTLRATTAQRAASAPRIMRGLYTRAMARAARVGAGAGVSAVDRLAYALGSVLVYGPLRDALGLGRVRVAYTAGEAVGFDLIAFFRSFGVNVKQLYGATETGFFVTMQRDGQVVADASGPVTPGTELRIADSGEILVRGPGLMLGYLGTSGTSPLDAEGWLHTGDVGRIGADGQVQILDRMGDLGRMTTGIRFAPRLIETHVKLSPYVTDAVAFGDGRDRVCLLIDIDAGAVGRWATGRNLSYTGHADLASRPEVYGLIAQTIADTNAVFALIPDLAACQIHRFVILPRPLDADDGVLTRMGKLRRGQIAERYGALVDDMYGGRSVARHQTETRAEDGGAQAMTVDLPIGDAIASAPVRKVA